MTDDIGGWTVVICDENRRRAYLDYQAAAVCAQFADDQFYVQIGRRSALPLEADGYLLAQGSWVSEDVVHEVACALIDDAAPSLSLRPCFERAQIMAAALNEAEWMKAPDPKPVVIVATILGGEETP